MTPTFSSLAAQEVFLMTTTGLASDDKVGIMTTFVLQWLYTMSQKTQHNFGEVSQP